MFHDHLACAAPSGIRLVAHDFDRVAEVFFEDDQRGLDGQVVWEAFGFAEGEDFGPSVAIEFGVADLERLAAGASDAVEDNGIFLEQRFSVAFESGQWNSSKADDPADFLCRGGKSVAG